MNFIYSKELKQVIDKIEDKFNITNAAGSQMLCVDYFKFDKWKNSRYFENSTAKMKVSDFSLPERQCIKQLLLDDIKIIEYGISNTQFFNKDCLDNFIGERDKEQLIDCYEQSKEVEQQIIRKLALKDNYKGKVRRLCSKITYGFKCLIQQLNQSEFENNNSIKFDYKDNSKLSFDNVELFLLYSVAKKMELNTQINLDFANAERVKDPYNILLAEVLEK